MRWSKWCWPEEGLCRHVLRLLLDLCFDQFPVICGEAWNKKRKGSCTLSSVGTSSFGLSSGVPSSVGLSSVRLSSFGLSSVGLGSAGLRSAGRSSVGLSERDLLPSGAL